ncbi:MAG: carbohydrate kinase family protein [Anaerolineae bacterium]|nr:carbohydrate kinase family protein [Anaerolineae bacterium]
MTASEFPEYRLPGHLMNRSDDVLVIGAGKLEMILRVSDWPNGGGQSNIDIDEPLETAGGCGMNVATTVSRLGGHSALIAALGSGRYGQAVWNEMITSGVATDYVQRITGSEGSLLMILTRDGGDWVVMQHNDPRVQFRTEHLPPVETFAHYKVLHVDGFSYMEGDQRSAVEEAVRRAHEAGCIVSVDAAVPTVGRDPAYVAWLFSQADIILPNEHEACRVTGAGSVTEAIEALRGLGPALCVLKQGPQGSWVVTADGVGHVPAFPVAVVDTIAAGDSYAGAMLLGLCQGLPLREAATRGSAAGALACLGRGSLSHRFTESDVTALMNSALS